MSQTTIADVAQVANISQQIVSRVLKGNVDYRPIEMYDFALVVIEQLNSWPGSLACSLISKGTNAIGSYGFLQNASQSYMELHSVMDAIF